MTAAAFVVALRIEGWAFGGAAGCETFRCGIGPRRAGEQTRRWLRHAAPVAVINIGICGGMSPDLRCGHLVLVEGWIDGPEADSGLRDELAARLTSAEVGFSTGQALTVRVPLVRPSDKDRAWRESGATICEMEGLALAEACADAGVPFAALRAVADDRDTVLRRPPGMAIPLVRSLMALRRAGRALRLGT